MERTIKFRTKTSTHDCGPGQIRRVPDGRWYIDTFALAEYSDVTIKKIKIRDRYHSLSSKIVITCDAEEQWRKFVLNFLAHFRNYMTDIRVNVGI